MFHGVKRFASISVAVAGGASVLGYAFRDQLPVVHGSWTTNHKPSVPWDWNWDKREPDSLLKPSKSSLVDPNNNSEHPNATDEEKKLKSRATRYIIMIRHGQYNLEGATDADRYLSSLGEEQAKLTGERIKALQLPITRLVHSTMTRATQTANIMMKHMNSIDTVEKCDLLREGAPIPPEPPVGSWKPAQYFYTDGARIEAAFRKYFHRAPPSQTEDSYEVLVCHANVIRYVVCRALQFPPEAWLRISLHNGSITLLAIRPDGRVSIRQLGDCGHMPPASLSVT